MTTNAIPLAITITPPLIQPRLSPDSLFSIPPMTTRESPSTKNGNETIANTFILTSLEVCFE